MGPKIRVDTGLTSHLSGKALTNILPLCSQDRILTCMNTLNFTYAQWGSVLHHSHCLFKVHLFKGAVRVTMCLTFHHLTIWGWEVLCVVQMWIYPIVKFIFPPDYSIPFSQEQHLVAGAGFEPTISAYETERITIFHIPRYVVNSGLEPMTYSVSGNRSNQLS